MAQHQQITHQIWLEQSTTALTNCSETPALDARVLLCHCLNKPLSYLLTWPDRSIEPHILVKLEVLLQRRRAGEPIAYITGVREFWSMNFKVSPDVLIPRPETEHLVEWALQKLNNSRGKRVLELGTGTGIIAISLAKEMPGLEITATDISEKALQIATENALSNQCEHITFIKSDWFESIADRGFDLILSNPPYIEPGDPHLLQGDLPYEPVSALVAEDKGLSDIINLVANARTYLNTNGWLGIEHGYDQGAAVRQIMQEAGYTMITTIKDLADNDRLTVCCRSSEHE